MTSFAKTLETANLMAGGIKNAAKELEGFSVSEDDAAKIEKMMDKASNLDRKQELAKSALKTATEELNNLMAEMTDFMATMKKRIKVALPQSRWKEFGITDKR